MNDFKLGKLFWAFVVLAALALMGGSVTGFILFAALAVWRYFADKNAVAISAPAPKPSIPVTKKKVTTPPLPVKTPAKTYKTLSEIPSHEIVISKEKRNRQKGFPEETFKNSGITKKGAFENFTVIDTETTGLAPYRDRIIQVSAIRFRDGEPVEKFCTYVNPKKDIPAEASTVNGITNDMVASAPTFPEIVSDLEAFIGDDNVVGHNLIFDIKFLYYSGCNILERKRKYLDTYKQSKRVVKAPSRYNEDADYDVENHKLPTLLEYFGIPTEISHQADSDALATGYLFNELVEQLQFDREYV